IERDVVGRVSRDRAYPIARRACVFLRVKDDHRETVRLPTTRRPRPVARLEAGRARDLWHNLAVEHFPSAVGIVDGHAHDESMHLRLLSRCFWSGELNAGRRTVMQRTVELTLNPGAGGRSSGDAPYRWLSRGSRSRRAGTSPGTLRPAERAALLKPVASTRERRTRPDTRSDRRG